MENLHENSPCCGGKVWRDGIRRRRCSICKKRWRIYQRRRGRKRLRASPVLFKRFMDGSLPNLSKYAVKRNVSVRTMQRRLTASRDAYLQRTSWPEIPKGGLIAVADATIWQIANKYHTSYEVLLRPIESDVAVITPPYWQIGKETINGWHNAFSTLSEDLIYRIVALVCDGHRGLHNEAYWQRWYIQRCHFHLLSSIRGRRSPTIYSRHADEGRRMYDLANLIITNTDIERVKPAINEIEELGLLTRSAQLRKIILGFVNHYEDYRTYLSYPSLRLPRTSNSAETFASFLWKLVQTASGYPTVESFQRWSEALIKYRRTIICRPSYHPN